MAIHEPRNTGDGPRFDVFIIEIASGKLISLIGSDLIEEKAERRIESGVHQTNMESYFVSSYPAGKFKVGDKAP